MTYDEVKERITGLISDPDSAPEQAIALLSDLENDYTTMSSMAEQAEKDAARIKDLQDAKQKLYLAVTNQEEPEEPEEKPPIDWDSLITKG